MFRIIKATLIGKLSRDLEYDSPTSKPVKVRISKIKASRGIGPNAEELGSFAARIIFTRSAHPENFRRQTSVPIYPAALPPAISNFPVTTISRGLRRKSFNVRSQSFGMPSLRIIGRRRSFTRQPTFRKNI